ncbi:RAN GTPase-activating protein 2 [Phytophthora cinnamomi]|uniref:RAN GTPase-activating protein 2 n=1 Tax=Phytophthora cinnamomi TaxID=4785 RepID=UPI003559E6E9|nr:RAN GTPase-activating protein 2 [Phytophthora cinnamomi]
MAHRVSTMILQAIVCLLLVAAPGILSADDPVQLSESFGGPHGNAFSDQASVAAGQTIGSLTIRAGERVNGVSLEVKRPTAATFSHGGGGGKANTLTLAADEHITSMEAHWGEKKGRTRIFYLSFGTSAGNTVSGGSQTESKNTVEAPEGFQLGGFFGQDGNEIDKLGAIWTRISAEAPATDAPAPAAPAPTPAAPLSESFGGPHGMDFSDENFVNSGQTVSSISVHAGERLDGITLQISAPKSLIFTHGGTGGDQKMLKLEPGEYIKSMEVHWGKKNDHTRIFYVNFVTSKGNSLAGGSMTNDKSTVTAPEGFQLAGFFGKDGKEIDTLGAVWAYIDLVTSAPTPAPAPVKDEDSPGTVAPADIAGSLSEVTTKANKRAVQLSNSFGGPHGEQFSDQLAVASGMTVSSVTIRAGERVDGLTLQVSAPKEMTFTHGGTGGKDNTLTLEPGEYITTMEAHWGQKGGHTRIFYLSLGTSKGKTVSGGSQTKEKGSLTAPKGYQLGGFFGRYGEEIDLIGAVWSSIATVNETVSPPVSADEDIVLGDLFGGPHGNAFSDIKSIKFGQTASSVTIRSAKRVDAVTLQVASPAELTFTHGGKGGEEQTLTLGSGEYINSMEAHWEKQGSHTRVFYLSFTTSKGKTISGGTKTDKTGVATAPEGFMLSGFYGRAADEVDQLGAIWTRMSAKNVELTDPSGVGNNSYGTTIRNWVGPTIGKSTDTACYRKTADFDSNNICPLGYGKDGDECITQCPISYPVTCSLECIPQNDDCALAVLTKIVSVIAVALNLATAGVFNGIYKIYKTAKWAIKCVANIVEVIKGLIYYLRYRQTSAPQGNTEELLAAAYSADVVLYDLPIAICYCMGLPIPKNAEFADNVLKAVEFIVKQAITNGDEIISTGANVMNLLSGNGIMNKSATTVDELQSIIDKNSSCGWQLKRLTDRVTLAVLRYRNVSDNVDDIRVKVYKSAIVLNDIPIVTNNCMGELLASKTKTAAYETRDLLRKTFGVIVDQLIDTGKTDMGKDVAEKDYMLKVANMGLTALSLIDPTDIAYMAAQFVQPICGPTAYVGEIDDGTLFDALGLTAVDEAFAGSYGSYTHAGDGVVRLIFESVDTKDVTVVVHSGGDGYTKVDVGAGDTVTWDSTFPQLEDKTLYLDRWRPGLLGLPGKGGGSLLMWIPRSSEGGHITMHVRINPS